MKIHYTAYIPEDRSLVKIMLSYCGWKSYGKTTNSIKNVTCLNCINKIMTQKQIRINKLQNEISILNTIKLEVK